MRCRTWNTTWCQYCVMWDPVPMTDTTSQPLDVHVTGLSVMMTRYVSITCNMQQFATTKHIPITTVDICCTVSCSCTCCSAAWSKKDCDDGGCRAACFIWPVVYYTSHCCKHQIIVMSEHLVHLFQFYTYNCDMSQLCVTTY